MISKFILGGAQFGVDYGIANTSGQVKKEEVGRILDAAIKAGVSSVDTARAYGNSEEMIGVALLESSNLSRLKVITKIPELQGFSSETVSSDVLNQTIDNHVAMSLKSLKTDCLDAILLHRAAYLHSWNGTVWSRLKAHRQKGSVKRLGVSVQNTDELLLALEDTDVEVIQLPFNILDWRWDKAIPKILEVKSKRKLEIHARSVFLQGLLLTDDASLWEKAHITNSSEITGWLTQTKEYCNCSSLRELCLKYVASLNWVDGIVVGVDSLSQFSENIDSLKGVKFSKAIYDQIESTRPQVDEISLNPALWSA